MTRPAPFRIIVQLLGAATLALLGAPTARAEVLFVTSVGAGAIHRIDLPNGPFTRIVGPSLFGSYENVSCSPISGRIFATSTGPRRLTSFDQNGGSPQDIIPAAGTQVGSFDGTAFDAAGNLYIHGQSSGVWLLPGANPANGLQRLLTLGSTGGEALAVVAGGPHAGALLIMDTTGCVYISEPLGAPPQILIPQVGNQFVIGLATNSAGEIFVASRGPVGDSLERFDPDGNFVNVVRSGIRSSFIDFDSADNLYAIDSGRLEILSIAPDGTSRVVVMLPPGGVGPGVGICRGAPAPSCVAQSVAPTECTGNPTCSTLTSVLLPAQGATETLLWTSDCPGAVFDDATVPGPELCLDPDACPTQCTATLTVSGGASPRTCSTPIEVVDTTPPVLQGVPPGATVACDAVPPPATGVSASDACDAAPSVFFAETRIDGSCLDAYVLTRRWTASDRCGNTSSLTRTVTVRDTVAPVLANVPADATVECSAVPAPATNVTASDSCDPAPAITYAEVRADGSCADRYRLTRTWTATDRCGNAASRSQSITVRDTTAPVLAGVPANATVECDAVPPPAAVTASDNCDAAPVVTFIEARTDGTCADRYTLARTWTATDRCGNAATRTQTITVRDTTPPVLAGVPPGVTVECTAVPPPALPTAADNCDPSPVVTFSETRTDGPCAGTYTLTRTWVATDRCGNAASAVQVVEVVDTTPPVVEEGSDVLACLWPPNHKYVCFTRADFAPTVSDACSHPVTWRFAGCASDQCDDAPCREHPGEDGDGSTTEDCRVSPVGDSFCVRAERAGTDSDGRRYAVSIVATDACGNASPPVVIGSVYVPHDQIPHQSCRKAE